MLHDQMQLQRTKKTWMSRNFAVCAFSAQKLQRFFSHAELVTLMTYREPERRTLFSGTDETCSVVNSLFSKDRAIPVSLFFFGKMDALKTITTEASKLEHSIEHRLTILWHELQEWQKDNQFIYSGYRPASNSYIKSWMRYAPVPPSVTLIVNHY
jgi:hypothetical protein